MSIGLIHRLLKVKFLIVLDHFGKRISLCKENKAEYGFDGQVIQVGLFVITEGFYSQ